MSAARAAFETGDFSASKVQLQWVIEHAREEEFRDVARLRLAGVLLDEKKYDEALALVKDERTPAFGALYADARGDILLAQGKRGEARDIRGRHHGFHRQVTALHRQHQVLHRRNVRSDHVHIDPELVAEHAAWLADATGGIDGITDRQGM